MNFKKAKILYISYFSIILIFIQLAINGLYYFDLINYSLINFLGSVFGVSLHYAIGWLILCHTLSFCKISRICAIAEVGMCLSYMLVSNTEYNILIQIILGSTALSITYLHYIKLFPRCKLAMMHSLGILFVTKLDCDMAIMEFRENSYNDAKDRTNN